MLPFTYAVRNLLRDPIRLGQKVAGSGIVVLLVLAAGSFNRGMEAVLRASGSPDNVIFLGAGSEESVERSEVSVRTTDLVAAGVSGLDERLGRPAVSGEVHYMGLLEFPQGHGAQAIFRGVSPSAFEVHREVRVTEGRYPRAGEVLVGRMAAHALDVDPAVLAPGATVIFDGQEFTVAGQFDAPGTVMESEVWMNRQDLMTLTRRESLSCVVARLAGPDALADAELFTRQRLDLELVVLRESEYYSRLAAFYGPIRAMAWLTAGLIMAGAVFGGLNMLYAAFASRVRELATLQAIGYGRPAILFSLVQESLLATLLGTLLATFVGLVALEGLRIDFSMGTFALGFPPAVVAGGLLAGLLLGLLGALPPAWRCLSAPLPAALRSG